MRHAFVALLFVSCATAQKAPPAEEERTVCETDPKLAATRIAKPTASPQCNPKASRKTYLAACQKDDFAACYQAGTCILSDALGQSQAVVKQLANDAAPFFKAACTAGMAEACRMRAGAFQESGTPAKDTCEDLVRASQLGDVSAQMSCMGACLL